MSVTFFGSKTELVNHVCYEKKYVYMSNLVVA